MGLLVVNNGKMVDSDLLVLDRQVKEGDAVSGWRGDPDMWVEVYEPEGVTTIYVMGLDAHRRKYAAASILASTPGWRHKLLEKLVLGDWQGRAGDIVETTMAANARRQQEARDNWADYVREELAPKLHWAFVKDGAAQRSHFYMTPKGVSK